MKSDLATPTSGKDELDTRRYANRIRDAYTLTEAEGFLIEVIGQSNQAAIRAALEGLIQKAFWSLNEDGDAAGVVSVSTIEAAIKENDIK